MLLTENNGPYLIMAYSFSGEGAEKQAQELVLELRKRYKLPAYIYKKRFELSKAQGRGFDSYGDPVQMSYHAGDKLEEVAVLVGDYPSLEDSDGSANAEENQIRQAEMPGYQRSGHHAINRWPVGG